MIATAGMFDVGKCFVGRGHAPGDLAPHFRRRTIYLARRDFRWSDAQQLAIQRGQPLKLLAASRTGDKMRMRFDPMLWILRLPAGFLEHFRYLRGSDMFFGVGALFQN